MKLKRFEELNEVYSNIIGDKKAKEIVKYWIKDAGGDAEHFPVAKEFLDSEGSGTFLKYIELYEELEEMRKGKRTNYEESNKIHEYIFDKVPNSNTMKIVKHYGAEAIEKFNKQFNHR